MDYQRQLWVDGESEYSAERMTHLEEGVYRATAAALSGIVLVYHGANASAPRVNRNGETFVNPALWVGSVTPDNRLAGDLVMQAAAVPSAMTIWSDSASTPGALGSTEIGALPWANLSSGTAYTAAKSGGALRYLSAGTGVAIMAVNDGATDCVFKATIAAKGTQHVATVFPRVVSPVSHLAIHRASSSDGTYVLSRRVSGATTVIATLAGFVMTAGDVVEVTTRSTGALKIRINAVTAYEGTVADFATATLRGVGLRTPDQATDVAFDDLSCTTIVG